MNIFLRAKFQNLQPYSVTNPKRSFFALLAGVFLLATLCLPKESFAGAGFGSVTVTPLSQSVCSGNSTTITFTGNSTCTTAGDWTANYIVESSPNGLTWVPEVSGTISASSPSVTYTTEVFAYTVVPTNMYYRLSLSLITNNCATGITSYNSPSATVTINPGPSAITGTAAVCKGATTSLTDSITGGTWTSSTTSVATVVGGTGVVTGANTGTSTITYTLTGGCYVTKIVTVNPNPAPPVGGTFQLCKGIGTTYNDATTSGTWSVTPSSIATIVAGSGFITGIALGTATVSYTLLTGCYSTQVVTVNPNPSPIIGGGSVCVGQTLTLSDDSTGGSWTSFNTTIASVGSATGIVTGVGTGGTTTIFYTTQPGNCYASEVMTVNTVPGVITGTTSVCVGSTITLADGTAGGSWQSSNTTIAQVGTASGVVTGMAGGTATISYILPTGCAKTVIVTVNPLPAAIGGTLSVCVNGTTSLTETTGSGSWAITPTTIATTSSTSGVVTGVSAGTATVTFSVNATGCYTTAVVTVNPLPSVITGTTSVCIGASTVLTDSTAGGTWTSSNSSVATVGSGTGIVNGVANGSAVISYTISTGCARTTLVSVNALPASITGANTVCVASAITLTDATAGGTWASSPSTTAAVGSTSGIVTGITAGTATISYNAPGGCSITTVITVNALPAGITGPSAVCVGSSITMSDATSGGTWTGTPVPIASVGLTTGSVTGVAAGIATVTYIITATGCKVTTPVTVNAQPAIITGTKNVCIGLTTTLGNSTVGGTWSSSDATIANINASNGAVTGINTGIVNITYTLSSGCYVTSLFTVNALPSAITGTPVVCVGATTTLSNTTSGGTWSSSATPIATVGSATGIVSGVASGTATISYSLSTGCYATQVVTVNALPAGITGASTAICSATTITLSDATSGGTWSVTPTTVATIDATGDLTGGSAGTATVTYTLSTTGCFTTTTVTVNALPSAIGGAGSVCQGLTTTLSDGTTGGTWSSSNTSVATIDPSTGVVTGIAGGTTIISYILTSTGCSVATTFTVNALPAAISGSYNVCLGASSTLSDAITGGSWTSSNTSVATIDAVTGVVTGIAAGTAIITYTLPSSCYTTATLTINPLSTGITGSTGICFGGTTTLSNATTGGTWSSSDNAIATVDPATGVVSSVSDGTVNISYILPTGCFTTINVTVNPIPPAITGDSIVCVGSTGTLSDVTTGGTWMSNNTTIATIGSATGIISGVSGGIDVITYTLPTSCLITKQVTINPQPVPISGIFSICMGTSTTLSDDTPDGTWSISPTSVATITSLGITPPSAVVTSVSPGTATVTYTLATGCSISASFVVNPLPPAILGNLVVCQGSSTTLTDAGPGGTWTSSTTSIATIGLTTGVLTGVEQGTTIVTYTYTSTGCINTAIATVNPIPAPISGPTNVCASGSIITLSDATTGGTWTSSNPAVATINATTGVVTGVAAGTTLISYTLTATGCYVTRIITVNPLPGSITGLNNVCLGLSTTLSDGTTGGTWSSSNTSIASVSPIGIDSVVVTGVDTGVATITYTLPTGCYVIAPVTVNPLPRTIAVPGAVCTGYTITLTDSSAGGTWHSEDTTVATISPVTGIVTGISTGIDTIIYTLSTGCTINTIITVNPTPTAIFGTNSVCAGLTTTLTDTTAFGIWSTSNPAVSTVGDTTGIVTSVAAGVDTISYTLTTTGCYVYTTFTVNPIPVITVNHPGWICIGGTDTLTASGAGAGGTYTWAPPAGLSCTTCATVIATPTVSTTYTVTGTTQFGCMDTATTRIQVDSILAHLTITGRDSICNGQCDTLIASGYNGTYFAWDPAAGLSCTICDTVRACSDITQTYTATAIDTLGCKNSASFTVTVMPLPLLVVDPTPATVCRNSSTQLTASGAGPGGTYAWFPNVFLSCDSCPNPIATDTMDLVYRLTGITAFGCYDSLFVPVSVLDNSVNTITNDTVICAGNGTPVHLLATSYNVHGSQSTFHWYPDTYLDNPNIANPTSTPDSTISYIVVITPNRCFSDTERVTIGVAPYPVIAISPSVSVVAGTMVPLSASITNEVAIASYEWTPSNTLSCAACYQTTATPTATTTYTFTAVSNYGCESSANVTVSLQCDKSQVFIPNTFTPNGDGVNDRFYISGKGLSTITRFSVYNRWGELVFEAHNINANDPGAGWDGTYKGLVLQPDVFVYVVQAVCELGGSPYTFTGDISIVR